MDDLRQSVQNAVYEQKDPLLIYKFESFKLFGAFISKINNSIVSFLYKNYIPNFNEDSIETAQEGPRKNIPSNYSESKTNFYSMMDNILDEPIPQGKIIPIKSTNKQKFTIP